MSSLEGPPSTHSAAAPEFYTWAFPGAPVRIQLHLNVVELLGREVRRAFDSVPAHSVEIGGLLLGRADFPSSDIIDVKHFEPFLCDYRTDHKFILSETDSRKLENLLASHAAYRRDGLSVVGFYRSHIGEGLGLRPNDVSLAAKYFNDPANVFLLVKPATDGSSTGGFFFWDSGRIDSQFSYLEFPFDPRHLTGTRLKSDRLEPDQKALEEQPAQDDLSLPEMPLLEDLAREASAPPRPRWLLQVLFAIAMMALGAAGYGVYMRWSGAPSSAAQAVVDAPALALEVQRQGADLRVSWNRHSFAVARASDGVLEIRDGDLQVQQLHLDVDQLRHGSIFYTPANPTVQFRLEVTDPDSAKTSETVLALTASRLESRSGSSPGAGATKAPAPPQTTAPAGDQTASPGFAHDFGEPVRVAVVPPAANSASKSVPELPQPSRTPAAPMRLAESYTPPQAMREVQPKLPPSANAEVTSLVEVQIRVQIDDKGAVTKAEPVPGKERVNSVLVNAARDAALRWRFEPAWRDSRPVASEVVLKFQYRPSVR